MNSNKVSELSFLTFKKLAAHERLRHGVSLRPQYLKGEDASDRRIDFNLSAQQNLRAAENRAWFCRALKLSGEKLMRTRQVHGNSIKVVHSATDPIEQTDGLCSTEPGIGLMLLGADCPLILVYDPNVRAVGVVHAGWRGTVRRITENLVTTMTKTFNCQPVDMIAGIGPAICVDCYEVGSEVVEAASQQLSDLNELIIRKDHKCYFDLIKANEQQLLGAGLQPEQIETSGFCTGCHNEWFHSYRREGKQAGRWGLLAGLADE